MRPEIRDAVRSKGDRGVLFKICKGGKSGRSLKGIRIFYVQDHLEVIYICYICVRQAEWDLRTCVETKGHTDTVTVTVLYNLVTASRSYVMEYFNSPNLDWFSPSSKRTSGLPSFHGF